VITFQWLHQDWSASAVSAAACHKWNTENFSNFQLSLFILSLFNHLVTAQPYTVTGYRLVDRSSVSLGPTQWAARASFLGIDLAGIKVAIHLHQLPKLKIYGALTPLPISLHGEWFNPLETRLRHLVACSLETHLNALSATPAALDFKSEYRPRVILYVPSHRFTDSLFTPVFLVAFVTSKNSKGMWPIYYPHLCFVSRYFLLVSRLWKLANISKTLF
jgi:hypothetical protein